MCDELRAASCELAIILYCNASARLLTPLGLPGSSCSCRSGARIVLQYEAKALIARVSMCMCMCMCMIVCVSNLLIPPLPMQIPGYISVNLWCASRLRCQCLRSFTFESRSVLLVTVPETLINAMREDEFAARVGRRGETRHGFLTLLHARRCSLSGASEE